MEFCGASGGVAGTVFQRPCVELHAGEKVSGECGAGINAERTFAVLGRFEEETDDDATSDCAAKGGEQVRDSEGGK